MEFTIDSSIQLPARSHNIASIGAGAIVRDAHLPAYQKAGWPVQGIYDLNFQKAQELAKKFDIKKTHESLQSLIESATPETVFDVAVPASALSSILPFLPDGSTVMIQKPLGENIQEATKLWKLCKDKGLTAGVNFQMKFIPSVIAAKNLIKQGAIGNLHDMEIRMNIFHPWHLWTFLFDLPRMEMLYHSIHYMDMLKYFFGDPMRIYAKTWQHPLQMELASTRSIIFFDYDKPIKAHINTNHGHDFGLKHQDSFIKWEGTEGAIKATLGLNINFPHGIEDTFEFYSKVNDHVAEWQPVKVNGSWYPDAFIGSMADLLCYREGTSNEFATSIDEALKTMQIVEAAYESSDHGGIQPQYKK